MGQTTKVQKLVSKRYYEDCKASNEANPKHLISMEIDEQATNDWYAQREPKKRGRKPSKEVVSETKED